MLTALIIGIGAMVFGLGGNGVRIIRKAEAAAEVERQEKAEIEERNAHWKDPASCQFFIERMTQREMVQAGVIKSWEMLVCERGRQCPECGITQIEIDHRAAQEHDRMIREAERKETAARLAERQRAERVMAKQRAAAEEKRKKEYAKAEADKAYAMKTAKVSAMSAYNKERTPSHYEVEQFEIHSGNGEIVKFADVKYVPIYDPDTNEYLGRVAVMDKVVAEFKRAH